MRGESEHSNESRVRETGTIPGKKSHLVGLGNGELRGVCPPQDHSPSGHVAVSCPLVASHLECIHTHLVFNHHVVAQLRLAGWH